VDWELYVVIAAMWSPSWKPAGSGTGAEGEGEGRAETTPTRQYPGVKGGLRCRGYVPRAMFTSAPLKPE